MTGKPTVEGIDPYMIAKEDIHQVMEAVNLIIENMDDRINGCTYGNRISQKSFKRKINQ